VTVLHGDAWRARGDGTDAGAAAALAIERRARLAAVTGGVAAGKSVFAAALAGGLRPAVGEVAVVASDGFLLPRAELAARGIEERKGFPESYDAAALAAFLDAVEAGDATASAPVYSHLTYDVVPGERVVVGGAPVVVVEGLHLAGDALGVGDRFGLVLHLDAHHEVLEQWYLERFRSLREAAAADPDAFLHPYVQALDPDALDTLALDVWRSVNLVLLHRHVRPAAAAADVQLHLGPDHRVERAVARS
jgi:type I pantothenate kinase